MHPPHTKEPLYQEAEPGRGGAGIINRTKVTPFFPLDLLIFLPGLGEGINSRPWGSSNLGGLEVIHPISPGNKMGPI